MTEILAIARFTALEAVRGRIAWLLAGAAVAGCALALLAGEIALTESQGFRAGLLGAWLRACAVLTASVFVIASMVREFDDKGVELVLAMPVPRWAYCAGKLAGFASVPVGAALVCGLALAWCAPHLQVANLDRVPVSGAPRRHRGEPAVRAHLPPGDVGAGRGHGVLRAFAGNGGAAAHGP